jgi:hypothetical protein
MKMLVLPSMNHPAPPKRYIDRVSVRFRSLFYNMSCIDKEGVGTLIAGPNVMDVIA